jgi:hypothetical protein
MSPLSSSLWHANLQPHSPLWHYLWLAPHLIQIGIAGLMIRRSMVRDYPIFFTYTVFEAIKESMLFGLDHCSWISWPVYWNVYGFGLAVEVVLRFLLINEIFGRVLRPYPGLKQLGRLLLAWSGPLLLVIAVAIAWFAPGLQVGRITYGYQMIDRTVSLVQSGLLVFLFLFASYFGISWRNFTFGIALGMGIFSSVALLITAIRVQAGPFMGDYALDFVVMATYHVSVLIWLVYLLIPESVNTPINHLPENDLEQWNAELERLLLQ